MNKSILSLIAVGIALSILHVPEIMVTVGIIGGLAILAIKLCWSVLQSYSQPSQAQEQAQEQAQRVVVRSAR